MLKFSIFLPTLKRPDLLRKNLDALELQTRLPDEVLISLRGDLDPEGVAVVDDDGTTMDGCDEDELGVSVQCASLVPPRSVDTMSPTAIADGAEVARLVSSGAGGRPM